MLGNSFNKFLAVLDRFSVEDGRYLLVSHHTFDDGAEILLMIQCYVYGREVIEVQTQQIREPQCLIQQFPVIEYFILNLVIDIQAVGCAIICRDEKNFYLCNVISDDL